MSKNEFGAALDANGYASSVLHTEPGRCFICRCAGDVARHEVYGASNRATSKRLGLWVHLCPACHALAHGSGVMARAVREQLRIDTQQIAMTRYGWTADDFRAVIGRSYL